MMCLSRGGGVCPEALSVQGRVSVQGSVCPAGGVCPGGGSVQRRCGWSDLPPVWTDRYSLKYNLPPYYVCGR